jgi:kinetochor protein Mis14/NSL1
LYTAYAYCFPEDIYFLQSLCAWEQALTPSCKYIKDVLHKTAANITINGLEPSEELINNILMNSTSPSHHEIEEHEPFNTRLFEKAKERAREEEELIEEIATLRRKIPHSVAETAKRIYKEGVEGDEEQLRRRAELAKEQEWAQMGLGSLERQEVVEASWNQGIKGLERLMKTMPEMVARKERAEMAEAVAAG